MSRTDLFNYRWTCNTPAGSAGTWQNYWRGFLENGTVCFSFDVILGAEEYSSLWGRNTRIFQHDDFAKCLASTLINGQAEFGTGIGYFQLKMIENKLKLVLAIHRYRDGSLEYGTFFLPPAVLTAFGLSLANLEEIDITKDAPFLGHQTFFIGPIQA